MVNDTISHTQNYADRLCNEIILWSNDLAQLLGITYGEIWAGITFSVIFMVMFYNVMLLLALYCPKLMRAIKYTYWVTHSLIALLLSSILMMSVAAP